jgi:glycosyltransferase involved in cell wall biosynthesis
VRESLAVALRVLRTEGPRAALERAWDRWREARRRGSFTALGSLAGVPAGCRVPVLNLAATAPAPRLGGIQGQLLRRLEAERELRPIALLYPEGQGRQRLEGPEGWQPSGGWRLELESGGQRFAVSWPGDGARPAGAGASPPADDQPGSAALAHAVAAAARAVGARAVQVEGLAGLPLGALARLRDEGFGLILAVHDFAAFCPRPHLLERTEPPRFCHFSREPRRCLSCLRHDWPHLGEGFQARRRGLAGELMREAAAVVYPSDYLRRAHRDLFAGLDPARERVIEPAAAESGRRRRLPAAGAAPHGPHGSDDAPGSRGWHGSGGRQGSQGPQDSQGPPGSRGRHDSEGPPGSQDAHDSPSVHGPREPLRHAAFVGRVDAGKGAEVFAEAVERLRLGGGTPGLRFSVFGGAGDFGLLRRLRRLPGVRVRGYYRDGSLPGRLAASGVELALLLSIVPESYGLTFDECAAAGVPVVAFSHGALGERVAAAGGLLLPAPAGLPSDAAALAALLARLASGEQALPAPPAVPPGRSPRAAAEAWARLYAELGLSG